MQNPVAGKILQDSIKIVFNFRYTSIGHLEGK